MDVPIYKRKITMHPSTAVLPCLSVECNLDSFVFPVKQDYKLVCVGYNILPCDRVTTFGSSGTYHWI